MALLRVLGCITLHTADGTEIRSVTAQPKRIALLAYLACTARDAPVRRDTVLALFWPELDNERARHALRQALYHLRRSLGADVIAADGDDELRLGAEPLQCDVCDFLDACHNAAFERALDLYRGDLLPGLYINGAVEYEQWLDGMRAELRAKALHAAAELEGAATMEGRHQDAAHWARRALHLAPFDEAVLRRLLEALVRAADFGGAVVAYEEFVTRAQRELGVSPAPETIAIVERLRAQRPPRRRRRADLVATTAAAAPAVRHRRHLTIALALAVSLAGAIAIPNLLQSKAALDPERLVVAPFRVLAAPEDSLLGEGVAELLTLALHSESTPRVVDARVASRLWRTVAADREPQRDLARALGAGLVLSGTAYLRAGELILIARLQDARTGDVNGTATVRGPPGELTRLVGELATRTLGAMLREDPRRLEHLTSTDPHAVRAWLAGRAEMRRGRYPEALALLEEALARDSTFAIAALDAVDVSGWSGSSQVRFERLAAAHRERLTPADTLHLTSWMGPLAGSERLTARDLFDASMAAVTALPDRPELLYLLGDRYYHLGAYVQEPDPLARSRQLFEQALALDPGFAPAREHLIEIAIMLGDTAGVRQQRAHFIRSQPREYRAPYLRWLAAEFLADHAELTVMRAAMDTMSLRTLESIIDAAAEWGIGIDAAMRAGDVLLARAATPHDRERALPRLGALLKNAGLLDRAERLHPLADVTASSPLQDLQRIQYEAMFSELMPDAAPAAWRELQRRATVPVISPVDSALRDQARHRLLEWNLWRGDTIGAGQLLASLRQAPRRVGVAPIEREVRLATAAALLEHARLPRTASLDRPALEMLDSLARAGAGEAMRTNFVLVRIFREIGDAPRALAAVRRRRAGGQLRFRAPYLLAEARLAVATADTAGALEAYRRYLAFRTNPDPLLRPHRDSARAEYARLLQR